MVSGKYKGVPMLLMYNITIKSIELKETDDMFYLKDKDSAYLIGYCHFKNGNKKYPVIKQVNLKKGQKNKVK